MSPTPRFRLPLLGALVLLGSISLPPTQATTASPTTPQHGHSYRDCADCPEMVVIPLGTFQMGSNDGDDDEKPIHTVAVGSFAIGKYEVTLGQWKAVMGNNPSYFKDCGDACPVENVSWDDVQQFIIKLSQKTGKNYRLPSEAEWEYAAQAGTTTKYWWGETASHAYANYGRDACCAGLAQGKDQWKHTAPVGQFQANAFGLHDMHGNVSEWVQDVYHDSYDGAPTNGSVWTHGGDPLSRVLRGGSWTHSPQYVRSAMRFKSSVNSRYGDHGFRLARSIP